MFFPTVSLMGLTHADQDGQDPIVFPWLETVVCTSFVTILVFLTVFRRRLSSNAHYRELNQFDAVLDDVFSTSFAEGQGVSRGSAGAEPGEEEKAAIVAGEQVGGATNTHEATLQFAGDSVGRLGLWRRPSFSRVLALFENAEGGVDYSAAASTFKSYVVAASSDIFSFNSGGGGTAAVSRQPDRLSRMSSDLLLVICEFLVPADIGRLSSVSRTLAKDCKADFIWEQLWLQNYGAMWEDEKVRELQRCRGIVWSPRRLGREGRAPPPTQGWFVFYLEWESCWLEWLMAGMCTTDKCVLGLGGSIYDITVFLPMHPGSQETLLDACGCDATEHFADIGHSMDAVEKAKKYCVYRMPEHLTCGQYQHHSRLNRHSGSRRGHITKFQSSMKREQAVAVDNAERCERQRMQRLAQDRARAQSSHPAAQQLNNSNNAPPPLAEAATDRISPRVQGYAICSPDEPHFGRARACYHPLAQKWQVWWTCCGRVHSNPEAPEC